MIYAGGVWLEVRKCCKNPSHLLLHLLSYSPGSGEDAAQGSFCQLLNVAAHLTFCTRLWLVVNVCKCCVRCDKNKHCCGILALKKCGEGICVVINSSPLVVHTSVFSMFSCRQETGSNGKIKFFASSEVILLQDILCFIAAGQF